MTLDNMVIGGFYRIETLGTTTAAVWNYVGASYLGLGASLPPILRVFECKQFSVSATQGTGTVSLVLYNETDVVSVLENQRFMSELIAGSWYTVRILGNTSSAN